MKRTLISFALTAIAAAAFNACSVAEQAGPSDSRQAPVVTATFTTVDNETKTAFGEQSGTSFPVSWTANDSKIAMSLNLAAPVEAAVNKDASVSRKANFTATFVDGGKPYQFYALSPLSAVNAISKSRAAWAVSIPTEQTPKSDGLSCDEAAMLIYAKSTSMQSIPSSPIELEFSHVTTYCRLALKNLSAALSAHDVAEAVFRSVDLTFSVPVAGEWYVNATDGSLEEKEASRTIRVNAVVADLSQTTDIWFALAPCNLDGVTVKVSVNTDKGCLSREYTYSTRAYAAGAVNKLSLDMTKNSSFEPFMAPTEETVYQLVESVSDLNKDDEVIFLNATTPTYAMSTSAAAVATNGFNAVAKDAATGFTYDADDKYVRLPEGSTVMLLTVASKSGSSFTFKSGSKYLASSYSGSTHYPTLASSAKTYTLAISSGSATLSYKSSSGFTVYSLYNTGTYFKIFASSTSVTKTMAIFKKATVESSTNVDPDDDPVQQEEQYGAYLKKGKSVHVSGATQLSREQSASSLTFAIVAPEENTVLEFIGIPESAAKGDSFSLSLVKNIGGKRSTVGTYNVKVVKEEGAKLWLSDGAGNGFIVKR